MSNHRYTQEETEAYPGYTEPATLAEAVAEQSQAIRGGTLKVVVHTQISDMLDKLSDIHGNGSGETKWFLDMCDDLIEQLVVLKKRAARNE